MTGIDHRSKRPSPAGAKTPASKLHGKDLKVKKLPKFSVPAGPLPCPPGCALVPADLLHQLQSEVSKTALPVLRQEAPEVQHAPRRKEPEVHAQREDSLPNLTHPRATPAVAAKAPKPRLKDGGARPIVIVKHAGVSTEDTADGLGPPGARHANVGRVDAVEEGTQTSPQESVQPAAPTAPQTVSPTAHGPHSGVQGNAGDENKAVPWQPPQPVVTPVGMAVFSAGPALPGSPDKMNSTDHGRFDLFGMDKFTAEKDRDRKRLQAQMLAEQIQELWTPSSVHAQINPSMRLQQMFAERSMFIKAHLLVLKDSKRAWFKLAMLMQHLSSPWIPRGGATFLCRSSRTHVGLPCRQLTRRFAGSQLAPKLDIFLILQQALFLSQPQPPWHQAHANLVVPMARGRQPPKPKAAVAQPVPYCLKPKDVRSVCPRQKPETPKLAVRPLETSSASMDSRDVRRVVIVADTPRPAKAWAEYLNQALAEKTHNLLACRLVVLAEGAIVEPGVCDDKHPAVKELQIVAKMNNVIIAAGSMVEQDTASPGESWQTCALIGQDGLIGSYRKQMLGAVGKKEHVEENLRIFNTAIGRIGILICLDIEDDSLLHRTAQRCDIIVNPAHIPHVGHGQRSHALQPVQRRLQWWALACRVSIVRCDLRPPMGMGTSMVVTPCETFLASAPLNLFEAAVPLKANRRFDSWHASRQRTEALDNTGAHSINILQDRHPTHAWQPLPQPAFGLELKSCAQGLSFYFKGEILHIIVLPEPPAEICFESSNLLLRDLQGNVWSLRAHHNNIPVSFRDILGPETDTESNSPVLAKPSSTCCISARHLSELWQWLSSKGLLCVPCVP
eukprot:symbB.v1.2.024138.t1/scaffold2263.1/size84088/7